MSQYITPAGSSLGQPLNVSGAGTVIGTFDIPNNIIRRFRTGKRKFVLADSSLDPNVANTYAEATYFADGTTQTIQ